MADIQNPDKPWESFEQNPELGWGEAFVRGAETFPAGVVQIASDVYSAVTSPIETGEAILNLASGALQHALPEGMSPEFLDPSNKELASAVGEHFANKYGSEEAIKQAISTDMAGVMADLSTVIGGTGLLAKAGRMPKLAQTAQKTAGWVDPLSLTAKGLAGTGYVGSQIAKQTAGVASGTGTAPLEQAYRAGLTGGDVQKQFLENIRGEVPMEQALEIAKQNLSALKKQKQEQYKQNEELWKADTQELSFGDIDEALQSSQRLVGYRGQVTNQVGAKALDDINKLVTRWKGLDPKQFHTPEGIDALKQSVWDIVENIPMDNRQARAVAMNMYHSVKNTISKQAPAYDKAMREYADSSDLINEITRSLSLGDKASVDTALRKLQSLMRDNVQTNYGQRAKMAEELEKAGGQEFMPALAGQTLQEVAPRGLQRQAVLPEIGAGAYFGGAPGAMATAGMSSPRISGMTSNIAGQVMRKAKQAREKLPVTNEGMRGLLNFLYQIEQQK